MNTKYLNIGISKFLIYAFSIIALITQTESLALDGPIDIAVNLNSTVAGGYINAGDSDSLRITGDFTFEAWIHPTGVGDTTWGGVIFSKEGEYEFARFPDGSIRLAIANNTPGWTWTSTGNIAALNEWLHIAIVYNEPFINTYFNAQLVNQMAALGAIGDFDPTHNEVQIGDRQNFDQPFKGLMDEVRVWNVARSAAQIQDTYNEKLPSQYYATADSGLIGYWPFDEITPVTDSTFMVQDLSIFGNDGVTVGDVTLPPTKINVALPGLSQGSSAWGDYDNDGDLDFLLTGLDSLDNKISRIYRNDSGIFTDINAGLSGVIEASAVWGDYDNDGDLDILLSGRDSLSQPKSRIYRNDSGVFTNINAGLQDVFISSFAWGDYDNDGDLDILINNSSSTQIYRNDPSTGSETDRVFTDINAGLPGVSNGSVAWGDYDNDGDLDILITGDNSFNNYISRIYRNDPSTGSGTDRVFTDINAGLQGVYLGSSAAWGDYDNDGDLDILLSGLTATSNTTISRIYRNDSGVFTDINAGLQGVALCTVDWGDYDNDGDLDVLLTGLEWDGAFHKYSIIYRNDSGIFTNTNVGIPGVGEGSVSWGDYDNDGDLDILITGESGILPSRNPISRIYRNNSLTMNTEPSSPSGLNSIITADSMTFSWNKASDNETPQDGLSYNLIFGNSDYNILLNSVMSDPTNGYRHIPSLGNAGQTTSRLYHNSQLYYFPQVIPPNYWGVQAVDNGFAGSVFSTEQIDIPINNLQKINNNIMQLSDLLSWEIQSGDSIVSYQVQIDDDSLFGSLEISDTLIVSISGSGFYSIQLQDLNGVNSLDEGTQYYWRIKPNYSFGLATVFTAIPATFWYGFISSVEENKEKIVPKEFSLQQNYPNPFNPTTTIKYALPKAEHVQIDLFDMSGRKIQTILDNQKSSGIHTFKFNAGHLASGIYIYRIKAGNFSKMKKLMLLK